jgi:type I restriction enzyme S subunit
MELKKYNANHTQVLKINQIVRTISETHKFDKDKLIAINTSDVENGVMGNGTLTFVDELKGQFKKTIVKDDILFSEIRPANRRFAKVTTKNTKDYVVSTKLMVLRKYNEDVDLEYFYYCLTNQPFLDILQRRAENRIGSFPQITFDLLSEYAFPIPPISEQKRISSVISTLDKKIALNRQINQNLEAMAKQLYDYWFVQFDFPNEEGKPYKSSGGEMVWNEKLKRKIPNEWDNCKLKDFINLFDSKRIPLSSKDREERKGNYPYYGATGIMDYVNEYIFDGDYILLAEDGSTSDSKGFPIVQYIWGKNWVNNHAHIILPKNEQYLMFTYQMLRSIPAKQIETGSIQKKISQENLCEYNMVLPNSILIEKYESIISPLWEKRKLCIEEINALIKQRDELLPLLMNGQASVNSDLSDD